MEWPHLRERMMSSISPKKRPHFPLWKSMVTSPPAHMPLSSFPAGSLAEVPAAFANVTLCSQSSLTLFVCWAPQPSERRPPSTGERRRGLCSWLGAPIHTTYGKSYTPFSSPDRGSQDGIQLLNNAVNAEFCELISQAGRPWPFLYF